MVQPTKYPFADFAFYHDTYKGRMSENAYAPYALRASAYVDSMTMNRASAQADRVEVKLACCAVAEIFRQDAEEGGGIASETVGKVSTTYVNGSKGKGTEARLYDAVRLYLAHTGLLYRGV